MEQRIFNRLSLTFAICLFFLHNVGLSRAGMSTSNGSLRHVDLPNNKTYSNIPRCTEGMLKNTKGHLIDLDGTIYMRDGLIPAANKSETSPSVLYHEWLNKSKLPYVYLSNGFKHQSCLAQKLSKAPFKISEHSLTREWAAKHSWTAAHAMASYLEDHFANKSANIFVVGSTVTCGDKYDSCFNVILTTIGAEARKNWQVRMDLDENEVYEWANAAQNGTVPSIVAFCVEAVPNDSLGGRRDLLLNQDTGELKKEFETLIDPVHGISRSAYETFDYALAKKVTTLLRNKGIFIHGAPDVIDAQLRDERYPFLDVHWPSMGAYRSFFITAAEFDRKREALQSQYVETGKGGVQGSHYMMARGFQLLKLQDSNLTVQDFKDIFMIGDNLMTDIKAANLMGMGSVFLPSGAHQLEDANNSTQKPTCFVYDIGELVTIMRNVEDARKQSKVDVDFF